MAAERFVLLGLAQVRSSWFRDMARWATTAMVPVEFLKAMSVEEVRARLRSGRSFSALIVDDGVTGLDRDLVDLALESGCAVIVVTGDRATRSWTDLGASALLPTAFSRADLLQVLQQVARPIARGREVTGPFPGEQVSDGFRARLVAVLGPGGAGKSTVSMAIAQGLARDARYADLVCLADLALDADQAMLHGSDDVVPGVVELVEAHRTGVPHIDDVRRLTWQVSDRGYHLLLGLRRHRDWTAVRPRAFDAALDGLLRGYRAVVADVDQDLEGESASGSMDIEDRNTMARSSVRSADLVVVVGQSGVKGVHSFARALLDVLAFGVPSDRVLPVVNRSPRGPRARSEITAAIGALLSSAGGAGVPSPVFLPERRNVDDCIRDRHRLPDGWIAPLAQAVMSLLERERVAEGESQLTDRELVPIRPGSLGSWTEHGGEDEGVG